MEQETGKIVVETFVKTIVCDNCKGLRVSVHGKPHVCAGRKWRRRRTRAGQVVVIAKHEATVTVTSAELDRAAKPEFLSVRSAGTEAAWDNDHRVLKGARAWLGEWAS